MFYRQLNDDVMVALSIPQHATELFSLLDENRSFLRCWIPWVDSIQSVDDVRKDINEQLIKFSQSAGLHETIFYRNEIVGVVGYQYIDHINGTGYIGYWLGERFNGKGIMTLAVKDIIKIGFEMLSLQKIDIRCTSQNEKSCGVPERLGFKKEGIARSAQKLHGTYVDQSVYGLLRDEFHI